MLYLQNGQGNALSTERPITCSIYRTAKEKLYLQNGQGNALSTERPRKCSIYRTAKEMLYLTVTPPFEAPITPREQRDKRLGQGTQRSVTARCSPARPVYTPHSAQGLCPPCKLIHLSSPDNRDKRQQSRGSGRSKPRLHL